MAQARVIHLTTSDLGLRYLLLDQLLYLRDQGLDVSGITSTGPHVMTVRRAGITVRTVAFTRRIAPLQDVVAFCQLLIAFWRLRPDIVHTHTPKASLLGQWAAFMARVPHRVHTIHGLYLPASSGPRRRILYSWLERLQMRPAHIVLSQNRADVETCREQRLCAPQRLRFLGNGVDVDRFDPRNRDASAASIVRRGLGIPDDHLVVGMIGRLVREKGYPEFFEAAAEVRGTFPKTTFLVIGGAEPSKKDDLTAADIARWDLGPSLKMLGHRDDVPALCGVMDLLVLPSHREGFPRALMEAAATGLPAVATDIRGCREAVIDGHTGLLVPPRQPAALAAAIARLLQDAELRSQFGRAARLLAETQFNQRVIFGRVMDTYEVLLRVHDVRSLDTASRQSSMLAAARYRVIKRGIDAIGGAIALAVMSPLILGAATLVAIFIGRPVLFRQTRLGLGGRPFSVLKLRTMRDATDELGQPLSDEVRLTRLGRALRATSIDELPQLANVIRGDMSLIGPRPLFASYAGLYTPEQKRRHEVRPGLTGHAQVNGRNALTWEQKFALDCWYVDHFSLALDLRIAIRTAWNLLSRRGINQPGESTVRPFTGSTTDR